MAGHDARREERTVRTDEGLDPSGSVRVRQGRHRRTGHGLRVARKGHWSRKEARCYRGEGEHVDGLRLLRREVLDDRARDVRRGGHERDEEDERRSVVLVRWTRWTRRSSFEEGAGDGRETRGLVGGGSGPAGDERIDERAHETPQVHRVGLDRSGRNSDCSDDRTRDVCALHITRARVRCERVDGLVRARERGADSRNDQIAPLSLRELHQP